MIVYIQTDKNGQFFNVNAFVAFEGFQHLGWEIRSFHQPEEITDLNPEILVVGGIGNVRKRLAAIGFPKTSPEMDYPPALEKYLGRKVWESTVEAIHQDPSSWNIFIKPKDTKKFAGKVIREFKDFIGLIDPEQETAIWCSEIVHFRTEWRCFIRYGEILDIRRYKGAWDSRIDLSVIRSAIADFTDAPASYCLDFAADDAGKMYLVEANDGHSLGTYGIGSVSYAKFLSARWAELTGTTDYTRF